jgi:hypothetical protein
MKDIDFLPVEFRLEYARRQQRSRKICIVVSFFGLLASVASSQYFLRGKAQRQLREFMPQYNLTVCQDNQLTELQARLQPIRATAELNTYLRHPWPRTQLLAALLKPLPREIVLHEVRIAREAAKSIETPGMARPDAKAEADSNAKLSPAARDLKWLRGNFDKATTLITITGFTTETALLHRYLGDLGKQDLFSAVDLLSIGRLPGEMANRLRFSVTVSVRPAYGQPGGPGRPKENSVASATAPHNNGNRP